MGCLFHKWQGCKCSKCGEYREKNHVWLDVNACCKTCTICGDTIITHSWEETGRVGEPKCSICGIQGYDFRRFGNDLTPKTLQALSIAGEKAYDLPFIYRSLAQKIKSGSILDAHEVIGIHGLYAYLCLNLSQLASPMAGQLITGGNLNADSIMTMDNAFKLRHEFNGKILLLQWFLGENDKEIEHLNTPEIRKKLGMYLDK